uniref:Fibrinolytic enzyme n=1 Tax=Enchytraeus japonensis TaxID=228735 RepID=H1A7B4_9ANNE|nr:fibrinolytic enzyme [Enchytraeus japonensis]
MLRFVVLFASLALLEARPSAIGARPSFDFGGVIGGTDASAGEFPWQLSQQRLGGSWSHSCGASLLGNTRALSAAHCVDGSAASSLRVVAGLLRRSDMTGTQTSNVDRYVMHAQYDNGQASFANDIAILHLQTPITTGGNIAFATLPANNNNNYAGTTCVISGWGRNSNSNNLPDTLQKANMNVLTTAVCRTNLGGVGTVWDNQICVQDPSGNSGACNGDSGGPLNCGSGSSRVVAGVTSWVVSSVQGNCLPAYPSVYTRTSTYLTWIADN